MSFEFHHSHFNGCFADFEIRGDDILRKKTKLRGLRYFLNEAKTHKFYSMAEVSYVPNFLGAGVEWNLRPYIEMELIKGLNLEEISKEEGRLVRRIPLLVKMADVVAGFHSFGKLHRDLKPKNFLEDEQGNVYLIDLGLAASLGHKDHWLADGTPAYMSPEAVSAKPLYVSSDIYSLGMIFYALLAGHPFQDTSSIEQIMKWQIKKMPRPLIEVANVSEKVSDAVMKCLRKDPDRRYKSAEYLRDDLVAVL